MKNRVIEIDEIKTLLPHRYPFLFVDRVLEIEEGKITGMKSVSINEPFFQGHFPNFPVMPGVLIVEALVQTAGIYAVLKMEENGDELKPDRKTFFTGIDGVKFKKPVRPGDKLILEATFSKIKMGIWWFNCRALVDGEIACVAEVSAVFK